MRADSTSLHELLEPSLQQRARSKASPAGASDAIPAVPKGLAAGLAAVRAYAYRKNREYADNRSDMAETQANKIRRNMGALELRDRGRFACVPATASPLPARLQALVPGQY